MAAQLPKPGVQVIQEFRSTAPTVVVPALVPCNVAPFFEIINVQNVDGTLNEDSKLDTPYGQIGLTIAQSSFPAPRGNVDQLDVDEDTIRAFLVFGGTLLELSQTSSFLTKISTADTAGRPFVEGSQTGPFNLDGTTLIVALDAHTKVGGTTLPTTGDVPTSANVSIDFDQDGMSISDVVDFINDVVPGLASDSSSNPGQLRLTSENYGAGASVLVRATGSANTALGFSVLKDQIAVGAGLFAIDDADGDLKSPRLEIFEGTTQRDIDAVNVDVLTAPDFNDLFIRPGDSMVAGGVAIGTVQQVFSGRLIMSVEQDIFGSDAPFAPRYAWVQANNLTFPAPSSSVAASLTGTASVADSTQAFIVAQAAGTFPIGAGESFDVDVVINGVAQPTEVIGSGAGWADLTAAITAINTASANFEAYASNDVGDEVPVAIATRLALRTLSANKGSGASITMSDATVGMTLGFSGFPVGDVGENYRYLIGTPAFVVGALAFGAVVMSETITYTPTVNGVVKGAETITWAAAHATVAAAIADWNTQALYTEAYEANAAGVQTSGGGFFAIRTRGEAIGADCTINVTATDSVPTLPIGAVSGTDTGANGAIFQYQMDGNSKTYEIVLSSDEDDNGVSLQQVLDAVNALTPNVASASAAIPPALVLSSQMVGEPSQVKVLAGTANTLFGFTTNQSSTGNGRPLPDMAIDVSGNVVIQNQILRSGLTGDPFANGGAPLHFSYKALRLDLSPDADDPGLLLIESTTQLEEIASPISSENPGALMSFLTLLNSPGSVVAAIGVPEVSADAPDGTPIGYAKALEFLESEEVYALSLGTQDPVVHAAAIAHVDFMSAPEQGGERIIFFNREIPDRRLNTLLSSGSDANTSATPLKVTVEGNVAPALIERGIDPANVNPTSGAIVNEIFLDLGGDDNYYLVQRVENGTDIFLRTAFATGDGNEDQFFATTGPSGVISDDWTLAVRGTLLLVPGTTDPDKTGIAETVQAIGASIANRRAFYVFPESVGINATGLEQLVPGYYAASCIVGMVARQPPQQGFTNFPITGLTQVQKSNDFFSNAQLNVMAAGGVYILIQEAEGSPIICRHQLSTNLSSIEVRELSITKVVDYTAKILRAGLRNFIGRSNITQTFLDQISSVVQGILSFLTENQVLVGAEVNSVIQDADAPDTLLIDVTLDVPYPANYIRLTLVV